MTQFIILHNLNGEEIIINPNNISKVFHSCVWVNGEAECVIESYETIKGRINDANERELENKLCARL